MSDLDNGMTILALVLIGCGGESRREPETPPQQTAPMAPAAAAATSPMDSASGMQGSDPSMQSGTSNGTSATTDTPRQQESRQAGSSSTDSGGRTSDAGKANIRLNDAEIAKITSLVNASEVEEGRLAQGRAKNARVRNFAAMMVKEHRAAQQKQAKLETQLGVMPADSDRSIDLANESQKTLAELKSTRGADFDREYIDAQVEEHAKALRMLEIELIPNAKSAEFRALLDEMRSTVTAHLDQAREIQRLLESGTNTGTSGSSQSNPGQSGQGQGPHNHGSHSGSQK